MRRQTRSTGVEKSWCWGKWIYEEQLDRCNFWGRKWEADRPGSTRLPSIAFVPPNVPQ